ncbi:MAG: hypothetical protein DWQ04_14740 [Chloroflexi bacterium]|nr:MAG: hypothetical protein DWQ04_14740 [Chloroflexota bacterium]
MLLIVQELYGSPARVSKGLGGAAANKDSHSPSISGNGRYTTFYSYASNLVANDTNNKSDIFLHYTGFSSTFILKIEPETIYLPVIVR